MLARAAHHSLLALLSTSTDRIVLEVGPDWRVLTFSALVVGLTTIAFALAPAVHAARGASLTVTAARLTPRRPRMVARELLVAVQVAMAVVLVAGALLFATTARNLMSADAGFTTTSVLFAHVFMDDLDPPAGRRAQAQRHLTERLAALPGIVGVAHASTPPLGGFAFDSVVGVPGTAGELKGETNRNEVSAGYFGVMRMPMLAGRDFSDVDTPASPKVAVVNEAFARKFFGGTDPLGRRFIERDQTYEIVGMVGDSKQYSLRETFRPIAYTATSQLAQRGSTIRFVLRAATDTAVASDGVRHVIAELAPNAGLRFATFDDVVAGSMQTERLMARVTGFFGGVAIVLAVVGLYGVVSYTAASRHREIAIRLALGARAAHVVRTVLGRVLLMASAGSLAGALLTIPATRVAASLFYRVQLADPPIVASILGIVLGSALVASWIPTRETLRTDPAIALRSE